MGTNITAFRLVDPNNPLVQEVVRWVLTSQPSVLDPNNPLVQEVVMWVPTSLPSAWWILTTLYCRKGGCKVGTNITAFRLDPNNPLVQEVVRWVPTSLPSVWWILTTL